MYTLFEFVCINEYIWFEHNSECGSAINQQPIIIDNITLEEHDHH